MPPAGGAAAPAGGGDCLEQDRRGVAGPRAQSGAGPMAGPRARSVRHCRRGRGLPRRRRLGHCPRGAALWEGAEAGVRRASRRRRCTTNGCSARVRAAAATLGTATATPQSPIARAPAEGARCARRRSPGARRVRSLVGGRPRTHLARPPCPLPSRRAVVCARPRAAEVRTERDLAAVRALRGANRGRRARGGPGVRAQAWEGRLSVPAEGGPRAAVTRASLPALALASVNATGASRRLA